MDGTFMVTGRCCARMSQDGVTSSVSAIQAPVVTSTAHSDLYAPIDCGCAEAVMRLLLVPAMLLRRCGGGVTASRPVGTSSTASGSDLRPSAGAASPRGLFTALGGNARFLLRWPVQTMHLICIMEMVQVTVCTQ